MEAEEDLKIDCPRLWTYVAEISSKRIRIEWKLSGNIFVFPHFNNIFLLQIHYLLKTVYNLVSLRLFSLKSFPSSEMVLF